MREIVPEPPGVVRNQHAAVRQLFQKYVVPTYARFDLVFSHGSGSYLHDVNGKRYLDLGGGIAVCALGHANPEITESIIRQSQQLVHVSNLYYHEPQGRLAAELVKLIAPGKVFFCNSGGEANEGLFKLARKFGHDEGRYEILTATNSFHGRTLAGIAATGQEKVKKGFEPAVPGFRHVPYNDFDAMRKAISPGTAAILIEGVQGEGGLTAATADYLLRLRQLCDEKKLLLFLDEVQCGHFRTGSFQSWQEILRNTRECDNFSPDGVSMAKSLGGGFPIGAFWVRERHADLLGAGTHASTYGGTPLACAVALKVLEIIQRDSLTDNVRNVGQQLKDGLARIAKEAPSVLKSVRGMGLMIGFELAANIPAFNGNENAASIQFVNRLHEAGLLAVPAGTHVIRLLPALNLRPSEAEEGLRIIKNVASTLAA